MSEPDEQDSLASGLRAPSLPAAATPGEHLGRAHNWRDVLLTLENPERAGGEAAGSGRLAVPRRGGH
jgi:hypothetical protein